VKDGPCGKPRSRRDFDAFFVFLTRVSSRLMRLKHRQVCDFVQPLTHVHCDRSARAQCDACAAVEMDARERRNRSRSQDPQSCKADSLG
jgi:hypothetical protein